MNKFEMKNYGNAADGLNTPVLMYFDPDLEAMDGNGWTVSYDGIDVRFDNPMEAATELVRGVKRTTETN